MCLTRFCADATRCLHYAIFHGFFWSALDVELDRAKRYSKPVALVMIDVDHFKDFNDRYGHPTGDEALCAVARVLEGSSRSHDVVARYGGEEFAVILPETQIEGATRYAEKILAGVCATPLGPGGEARLSISAGIAASGADVASPMDLVARADKRLYRAKHEGRNRACADEAA
jgi:diguanylate cyclase (GGDEF)-like protein